MTQPKYFAIIPAAGIGRRFDHATPKQFLTINAKAIIEYALQPLVMHPQIERVVVAMTLPNPYWDQLAIAKHPKITLTEGGEQRADSVLSGLLALDGIATDQDWVLVHDAARPCLTTRMVQQLITSVADHPVGGLLAVPVRDTLKRCQEGHTVESTVPRDHLWQAQTPQQCRYGLLKEALLSAISHNQPITDEAQALEMAGHYPLLVEGAMTNVKLTHPQDFSMIAHLLATQEELI